MFRKETTGGLSGLIRLLGTLALGVVVLLVSVPAEAQYRGKCATADTPWPVVLPDGSVHDGSRLKVCLRHSLNPVTGLHEINIDRHSFGRFMSRIGESEGRTEDTPVLVFHRNALGQHRLVGYAWPHGDSMTTYRLFDLGRPYKEALKLARAPLLKEVDSDSEMVLMAGRLD
jgi:hypothetical protein